MKMFQDMIDAVIYKYGFESEESIFFCRLCESKISTLRIVWAFDVIMNVR